VSIPTGSAHRTAKTTLDVSKEMKNVANITLTSTHVTLPSLTIDTDFIDTAGMCIDD